MSTVGRAVSPRRLAMDRVLADGEWHPRSELLQAAYPMVEPGHAYRRSRSGDLLDGAVKITLSTIEAAVSTGAWEREGRGVDSRFRATPKLLARRRGERRVQERVSRKAIIDPGTIRGRVAMVVADAPGLNRGEVAERLPDLEQPQVWRRLSDLKNAGLLAAGEPREYRGGKAQQTWWPTPALADALRDLPAADAVRPPDAGRDRLRADLDDLRRRYRSIVDCDPDVGAAFAALVKAVE